MTITYPRELHPLLTSLPQCYFDYSEFGSQSRTTGGAVTFQEKVGGALWEFKANTKPLRRSQWDSLNAWLHSLVGRSFKAYDPHRCYPLAYGASYPTATCTVTAAGGEVVSLSGLPAAYIMSEGDYLSFDWRGNRHLLRAFETKVADGSGVIANLTAGPWLIAGGTVPVTATLVRAWCLMKPAPGSWQGARGSVDAMSFEAIQHLV